MSSCTCEKCHKTMDEDNFYTYKTGGRTELCKKCLTMHIDNFNPDTFLWLLEKMDVPYIEQEWNVLRDRAYAKGPTKMNGMSVFGKYLSKMKLKQFKDYTWADTERLKKENEEKIAAAVAQQKNAEAELSRQYENGEITEAQYKTLISVDTLHAESPICTPPPQTIGENNPYNEANFVSQDALPDVGAELTEEEKLYLVIKWGRLYKLDELVKLEKTYNEMSNAFEVNDPDSDQTLMLICKTALKMNNAIDIGDMDGYQKLSRVYDTLRKSAKFTAAQNKEQKGNFVDSVTQIVAMCEKEGFIPRFATDIPQDKVDLTLKDMNNYVRKLVTQDLGFGQQIEDSIKKLQIQKEMREQDDEYDFDDERNVLDDIDYEEYYDQAEEQKEKDMLLMYGKESDYGTS